MEREFSHDVFISFSFKDQAIAENISNQLNNIYGISCWICTTEIRAGDDFYDIISDAITASKVLLFVQTKNSVQSAEIRDEISFAIDYQKDIVPFVVEDSELRGMLKLRLAGKRYVDGKMPTLDERIEDLARELCTILGRPFEKNQKNTSIPVYKGNSPYIFISYSHLDQEQALRFISLLQKEGYRVWYDDAIEPSTNWDDNIASHVVSCGYFVALISKNYLNSENCLDELNFAREKRKNRLLIYLEDIALPDGMAMRLTRLQAIQKYKYTSEKALIEKFSETKDIDLCRL